MSRKRLLFLTLGFLVILINAPLGDERPSTVSQSISPVEQAILSEDPISIRTAHGTNTNWGNGSQTYTTRIGESNEWNGTAYVPYIWDDTDRIVDYANHSLEFYDFYSVVKNETHTLVEDMRWQVYYWDDPQWRFLDLYSHDWLTPVLNENNMTFGQSYTDGFSEMNVTYTFRNQDAVKIGIHFVPQDAGTYRFVWQVTGMLASPVLQKGQSNRTSGITFDDLNILWGDVESSTTLNATFDWLPSQSKVDIQFSPIPLIAQEPYFLDPTVSPSVAADGDDCYWEDYTTTPVIKTGGSGINWDDFAGSLDAFGAVRFVLAVPAGVTITDADIRGYEIVDGSTQDGWIERVDEANCGAMESRGGTPPTLDDTYNYTVPQDGVDTEWSNWVDIDAMVTAQIAESGWTSGWYIGFGFKNPDTQGHSFEDYSSGGSNQMQLEVDYNAPPEPSATPECDNLDDTTYLYAYYREYVIEWNVTDDSGYADIDYTEMSIYDDARGTEHLKIRYDEDTDSFTEEVDGGNNFYFNDTASSATESGDDIGIEAAVTVFWNQTDLSDIDIKIYVIDTLAESNTTWYEVDWDIETRLDLTGGWRLDDGSGTIDRGTYNTVGGITANGTVIYFGSGDNYPPADEIDVWITCTATPDPDWEATNYEDTGGTFSVSVDSDNVVTGSPTTYTFKTVEEGDGSGGTDQNHATHTDTYKADRVYASTILGLILDPTDGWVNIGESIEITAILLYEYDDVVTSTGSFDYSNGSLYWDAAYNVGWRSDISSAIPDTYIINAMNGTDVTHGVTGAVYMGGMSKTLYFDRVDVVQTINYGWTVIGYNITISWTGTYNQKGGSWTGDITDWDNCDTEFPSFSTTGLRTFTPTTITDPVNGITNFTSNTVSVTWDDAYVSSVAYYWVQYSPDHVWMFWASGTWTWEINATTLNTGADNYCAIQSHMNETEDDWAIVSETGDIGDLIIGEFNTDWYYVNITINAETTINGRVFDWAVWTKIIGVQILHTIYIENFEIEPTDFYFWVVYQSNWNNATIMVWDDAVDSGTTASDTVLNGTLVTEGMYYWERSTIIGTHNVTILINGTATNLNEQVKNYIENDGWWWYNFSYIVTDTLSVDNPVYTSNEVTNYLSGTVSRACNYYIFENDSYIEETGPLSEGSFSLPWDRDTTEGLIVWAVKFNVSSIVRWVNGSYYNAPTAAEADMMITGLSFTTGLEEIAGFIQTNWDNTTLYVYDNDTLKVNGLAEGSWSFLNPQTVGLHQVGCYVDGGAQTLWVNFTYSVSAGPELYLTTFSIDTAGYNVTAFAETSWDNATLTLYEGDVQKDTGAEGTTLAYTKSTSAGDYDVALKVDGGLTVLWVNTTYSVSEAEAIEGFKLQTWDISWVGDYVFVTWASNWGNSSITPYEDDSPASGTTENYTLQYTKLATLGDHTLDFKIDGGTGNVLWKNYTYTISASTLTYDWSYIYTYNQGGDYVDWENFVFYINGTELGINAFYNRTDYAYEIAIYDIFGDELYNQTLEFDRVFRITLAIHSFQLVSELLEPVWVRLTSSGGGYKEVWLYRENPYEWWLYESKSYQWYWNIDSPGMGQPQGPHYYPTDGSWYSPTNALMYMMTGYGMGELKDDIPDSTGGGGGLSQDEIDLIAQSVVDDVMSLFNPLEGGPVGVLILAAFIALSYMSYTMPKRVVSRRAKPKPISDEEESQKRRAKQKSKSFKSKERSKRMDGQ